MRPEPPSGESNSAYNYIYWRDEILQVMFWLRGEGLSEAPSAAELAPFLTSDAETLEPHLHQMVRDEFLTYAPSHSQPRYALSERGRKEGGRLFQQAFDGLTNQGHGECNNPDCSCKTLGPQACESRQHAH